MIKFAFINLLIIINLQVETLCTEARKMSQNRRTKLLHVPEVRFACDPAHNIKKPAQAVNAIPVRRVVCNTEQQKPEAGEADGAKKEEGLTDSGQTSQSSESSSEQEESTEQRAATKSAPAVRHDRLRRLHSSAIYDALQPTHPRLASYWMSLRPWSFSASLAPLALGTVLAYKAEETFYFWTLVATLFTILSVHGAGNLVNTFFDYHRGIDSIKSDDRTLVDSILTTEEVINFGALLYFLGCVGFVLIDWLSPAKMEHLALIYFGGLSSSFLYTGGFGLKYIALGDVIIIITFGPVCMLFAFIAQTGQLSLLPLWYAIPLALNTEAILHANNARDVTTDKRAGIVTVAILLGPTGSYVLFVFLLFIPYLMFTVVGMQCTPWLFLPLLSLPGAFHLERQYRCKELRRLPSKLAKLNLAFGLLYTVGCMMANTAQLPGFS